MAQREVMVLVTLEEPFEGATDKKARLNIGWEDCVVTRDGYAHSDRPDSRSVVKPGARIVEVLDATDYEKCSALIPEGSAKLLFGDWDAIEGHIGDYEHDYVTVTGPNGQITQLRKVIGAEADRVASNVWGDYRRKEWSRQNDWSESPVGPPSCPHVRIERIDRQGHVIEGWVYRPWDFFRLQWIDAFADQEMTEKERRPKVVKTYPQVA